MSIGQQPQRGVEELLRSPVRHFVYGATGHISSHIETHKHGKHPSEFNTPKHMDVPEDCPVMISAAGNNKETHAHTKGFLLTMSPSWPQHLSTPYRGLWAQITSTGTRKKYGAEQEERVRERERERENRHLEMSGGVFIEEDTEVLSKHVSRWMTTFSVWNTNTLPPSVPPGINRSSAHFHMAAPAPSLISDCYLIRQQNKTSHPLPLWAHRHSNYQHKKLFYICWL